MRQTFRNARVKLPQPWSLALGCAVYLPALAASRDTRRHFREEAVIELNRRPRKGRFSERVVEIPWVAERIPPDATRVLDTGTAYAPLAYHRLLYRLPAEVVGADLTPFALPGVRSVVADLRALPFEEGAFDVTLCISTLEHIGMDNRVYDAGATSDESGDLTALRELGRVTKPGGRLLVTVPGGREESFGWHRQYSPEGFGALVESAGLRPVELGYFAHDGAWRPADADELANFTYGQGAPAAAALICAHLTR
jgi:SAM-dependent methyltransferase